MGFFGFRSGGAVAFTANPRGTDVRPWCGAPCRSWVALLVRLGLETLPRFDDLSFVTARSVKFAREGGVRVLSVCFTHEEQDRSSIPVSVHVFDSGSPYCAYRLMVHTLAGQCGLVPGIDDPLWVFPATGSVGDLGSGAGSLFPRLTCGRSSPHTRFQYDPAMDWSARAATPQSDAKLSLRSLASTANLLMRTAPAACAVAVIPLCMPPVSAVTTAVILAFGRVRRVSASICALMRWAAPALFSIRGLHSSGLNWVWEIPTWMLLETRPGTGCCGDQEPGVAGLWLTWVYPDCQVTSKCPYLSVSYLDPI